MNNIPKGYKQTEVGVIPEEWRVESFLHVTDLITCGIAATPKYVAENIGYPFLSSTNIKNGVIQWTDYKYIDASLHRQLHRNNPPKRGDILYSRVGTIGEAAVIEVDFEFSVYVSLTLIKPKTALDSYFLAHLLNSLPYKQRAKDQVYLGGGVGNLNVDVVRRYPIIFPPILEQRAIAAVLSNVDALLAKLDQLIAKKRDLKLATMQQLLTGQDSPTRVWPTRRGGFQTRPTHTCLWRTRPNARRYHHRRGRFQTCPVKTGPQSSRHIDNDVPCKGGFGTRPYGYGSRRLGGEAIGGYFR